MIPLRPQDAFWISQPFSGLRSMATYIGSPIEIHGPPRPYHLIIDSSTQMVSPGVTCASRWALMEHMKSLMSAHR